MEQLKVGFATSEDHAQIVRWLNERREFDASILKYPTLQLLKSYNGSLLACLPVHRVLMLESSAIDPEAPALLGGRGLMDLVKASELVASAHGCKELYFLGTDEKLNGLAEKYGFERLPWPVMRMKL